MSVSTARLQAAQTAAYDYWEGAGLRSASLAVVRVPSRESFAVTALASKSTGELVRAGIWEDGALMTASHGAPGQILKGLQSGLALMPESVRAELIAAHAEFHYGVNA
jgi:hypothetical protein